MSRRRRVLTTARAEWRTFRRRPAAVFFTFVFPLLLVVIFGALVRTGAGSEGIFAADPTYYLPGYLATVVLFTPLQRVGGTVARARDGRRFQKLATTPLTRADWLAAQALVNGGVVLLAGVLVMVLGVGITGATPALSPLLPVVVALGAVAFVGLGAVVGRVADSHDGAIAAGNAVALPLLFLSETFVQPSLFPAWFRPALDYSPLTYFARAARATMTGGDVLTPLAVLVGLAVVGFAVGTVAVPWRS